VLAVEAHRRALEGLRQRAAIVGAKDRQHRHHLADLQLGVGQLGLAGHRQAVEVVGRFAVLVDRQHLGAAGATNALGVGLVSDGPFGRAVHDPGPVAVALRNRRCSPVQPESTLS